MKHPTQVLLAVACAVLFASQAQARDSIANYSIDAAIKSDPGKISADIALYFAGQPHPSVTQSIDEAATNKKTNGFGKSDLEACQRVFLSALIELQERARKDGGNAVINIKSNYKNELHESATEFVCGSGAVISGVALKGDVVRMSK